MPCRVLLILTLVAQQLVLPLAAVGAPGAGCGADACCEVVTTTTCCGEVVREARCGKTGGDCLCAIQPGDSAPAPVAPRPQERTHSGPVFAAAIGGAIDLPAPVRAWPRWAPPAIHRTHNETQALLGVWRT